MFGNCQIHINALRALAFLADLGGYTLRGMGFTTSIWGG